MLRKRFCRIIKGRRATGYVDVAVMVLSLFMVMALSLRVLPVFIAKQQLDTFAAELMREAEISGRIGPETDRRADVLRERMGIDPQILWSDSGQIQLNQEVTVNLMLQKNIGLFGNFGSFPVTLRSQAAGKSEVYWK